jgi:hypothetical protein
METRKRPEAWRTEHRIGIAAAQQDVWQAVQAVTLGELRLTRLLLIARGLPARFIGRLSGLAAAGLDRSFVDALVREGFEILDEAPPDYVLGGGIGQPWRFVGGRSVHLNRSDRAAFDCFVEPGFVKMTLEFDLVSRGSGTRLSTRTTVTPTDVRAARSFARYWLVVRVGSDLVRRDLLRAIAARAESQTPKSSGEATAAHTDRTTR